MNQKAEQEKTSAAASSVVAAVVLTLFKIIVGISTGSLGILAEAAHSILDLVAAIVTLIAVRMAGKPADAEHRYGHGKIENLSALFETLLLLLTCVWIISEAVGRLFFKQTHVEASFWAFLVMVVSIVIDFKRSRVLGAAARKHNSQALEADALHFSTDIWSSSVVIVGLIGVYLADRFTALSFLVNADSIAALGVALIVIYVSIQLGIRTIKALLDTSSPGRVEGIIKAVEHVPGVIDIHNVRVRDSGPYTFVDAHVSVEAHREMAEIHELTERIEQAVNQIIPNADVLVHPEPLEEYANLPEKDIIQAEVEKISDVVDCHNLQVYHAGGRLFVSTHVLINSSKSLEEAHEVTDAIEASILRLYPQADVSIHPEPANNDLVTK